MLVLLRPVLDQLLPAPLTAYRLPLTAATDSAIPIGVTDCQPVQAKLGIRIHQSLPRPKLDSAWSHLGHSWPLYSTGCKQLSD